MCVQLILKLDFPLSLARSLVLPLASRAFSSRIFPIELAHSILASDFPVKLLITATGINICSDDSGPCKMIARRITKTAVFSLPRVVVVVVVVTLIIESSATDFLRI